MKATGMVRPVDTLGRIVIPREIRKMFDIKDGEDHFEIFVSDNQIILKKYKAASNQYLWYPESQRAF